MVKIYSKNGYFRLYWPNEDFRMGGGGEPPHFGPPKGAQKRARLRPPWQILIGFLVLRGKRGGTPPGGPPAPRGGKKSAHFFGYLITLPVGTKLGHFGTELHFRGTPQFGMFGWFGVDQWFGMVITCRDIIVALQLMLRSNCKLHCINAMR